MAQLPTSITTLFQANYPICWSYSKRDSRFKSSVFVMLSTSSALSTDGTIQFNEDTLGGQNVWGLPGGKVEADETHYEALMREYYEETGMSFEANEPHYLYTILSHMCVIYVFTCNKCDQIPVVELGKVASVQWIPQDDVYNAIATNSQMTIDNKTLFMRKFQHMIFNHIKNFEQIDKLFKK